MGSVLQVADRQRDARAQPGASISRLAQLNKPRDGTVNASKGLTAAERIRLQLKKRASPGASLADLVLGGGETSPS